MCDLTPNHQSTTKNVFYESSESESALFCISPALEYLCGPYFKVIARTNHGNPAVPVCHSTRLGSRSAAAAVQKNSLFLNCAPPPHPTTKPSRGWLLAGASKPHGWFCPSSLPHEIKLRLRRKKGRTGVLGCGVFLALETKKHTLHRAYVA